MKNEIFYGIHSAPLRHDIQEALPSGAGQPAAPSIGGFELYLKIVEDAIKCNTAELEDVTDESVLSEIARIRKWIECYKGQCAS